MGKYTREIVTWILKDEPLGRVGNDPLAVAAFLKEYIGGKAQEELVVLCLDNSLRITTVERVSVGTINATVACPREIFRAAVKQNAASIIVAHNHPSGNRDPSKKDIEFAKQLVKAGEILGISVIDQFIITKDSYTSLAGGGYI